MTKVVLFARVPVIGFTVYVPVPLPPPGVQQLPSTPPAKSVVRAVQCDLTRHRHYALLNSSLIRDYLEWDSSGTLRQLLLLVKLFAKRRGLADASCGYLSSYSWVVLSLHVLLRLRLLPVLVLAPETQRGYMLDSSGVDCNGLRDTPVSVLLLRVLSYFSSELDVARCVATLRGHGEVGMHYLLIEDNCYDEYK